MNHSLYLSIAASFWTFVGMDLCKKKLFGEMASSKGSKDTWYNQREEYNDQQNVISVS